MPLKIFREHGIGWAVFNYLRIAPVCGAAVSYFIVVHSWFEHSSHQLGEAFLDEVAEKPEYIHGEMKEKMKAVFDELFKYHHKREFSGNIYEEMLHIAWHPDRFWDWCVDEKEKGFLEGMWRES